MFFYSGLKFPHRAVVLLLLEGDGACTSLNDNSARNSLELVLVYCSKPGVIGNRICEGTECLMAALSSGITSI